MTLAALTNRIRRLARADETFADDNEVNSLIQEAVRQMSRDVGGFAMDVNLYPDAKFDTETNYAIRVEITGGAGAMAAADVAITATAREDASGSTVASDLQTAIQAAGGTGVTVAWSNFAFTITSSGATDITISSPSATTTYVDATTFLGLSGSSASPLAGSFPEDCTNYVTLPGDALAVDRVEWDSDELIEVGQEYTQSSESQGDPIYYTVRDRRLYLAPSPDTFKQLEVWYRGEPADIDFATDVNVPTEIPSAYQPALAYLVSYYLLLDMFEDELAKRRFSQYVDTMRKLRIQRANNSTAIEENTFTRYPRLPKVSARQGF